mmetsp:Transcript_18622/g.45786  ORF Transcript_18622/g.45786 Transcript_18622/m.45786 type:complete len:299 (+) Transcript_18622:249-1145(+)
MMVVAVLVRPLRRPLLRPPVPWRSPPRSVLVGDDGLSRNDEPVDVRDGSLLHLAQRDPPRAQVLDASHARRVTLDLLPHTRELRPRRHRRRHRADDGDVRGVLKVSQRGRRGGAGEDEELKEVAPLDRCRDAGLIEPFCRQESEGEVGLRLDWRVEVVIIQLVGPRVGALAVPVDGVAKALLENGCLQVRPGHEIHAPLLKRRAKCSLGGLDVCNRLRKFRHASPIPPHNAHQGTRAGAHLAPLLGGVDETDDGEEEGRGEGEEEDDVAVARYGVAILISELADALEHSECDSGDTKN